ncbi:MULTISPECIES: effector-associated domain EAD1-containing protein [Protofrankia]|uniref:Effector-associated domain-containing protein n=1 Tax=Candidatus Protofrankia datiscae TaxID=2716812 RepID=F8B348_9ACTN|nr:MULTISPECIES: effector-associated domain EAD1-containing protein [Protofrankia]AEH09961.1 hypothetical protein FsymDg_2603 [Candidatus Protofrankia datiscae]
MADRSTRLTEVEVAELAHVLHSLTAAIQVLDEAGMERSRMPYWQGRNALEFWHEVNVMLDAGVLIDGRRRVLAAAARWFPANDVFRRVDEDPHPRPAFDVATAVPPAAPGEMPAAGIRSFVTAKLPPVQRWMDMDGLVEVVARLLAPGEIPLDVANGAFGRSVPGSGIMLLTDHGFAIADRVQGSGLGQVIRVSWPLVTEVRLSHRRRVVVAVSDVELMAEGNRIIFRGVLREPAIRIADRIRTRLSAESADAGGSAGRYSSNTGGAKGVQVGDGNAQTNTFQ